MPLSFDDPSIVFNINKGTILEASAGSGKTTTLTERWLASFLYLLVWEKYSVSEALQSMTALTFTKKAASEMKSRIRKRIQELWDQNELPYFLEQLRQYVGEYPVSLEEILSDLSRQKTDIEDLLSGAKIMTINAFVFYILRSYPLELNKDIGLNPEEDSISVSEKETRIAVLRKLIQQPQDQPTFPLGVRLLGLNTWIRFFDQFRDLVSRFGDQAIYQGLKASGYLLESQQLSEIVLSEDPEEKIYYLLKPSIQACKASLEQENSKKNLLKENAAFYEVLNNCTKDNLLFLFSKDNRYKESKAVKDEEINQLREASSHSYQQLVDALYRIIISLLFPISELCTKELKKRQAEYGEISFGDSEIALLDVLQNLQFLYKLQSRMRFFFTDEYQDTSDLQKEIFDKLISSETIIPFFVGDPKQSIYSFRNANVYLFNQTIQEFQDRDYQYKLLNTNYRSTAGHVDLVNYLFTDVFRSSPINYAPQLSNKEGNSEFVYTLALGLEDQEKYSVQEKLQQAYGEALIVVQSMLSEGITPGEIMILFRNRLSILEFYRFAKEYAPSLPLSSSVREILWDSVYISPLISFLKVLLIPYHDLSMIELLKTPIFRKSDIEINELLITAKKGNKALFDVLPDQDRFLIQEFLVLRDRIPLEELISLLVKEIQYEAYLDLISETGEARATLTLFIEEAQKLQVKKEMSLGEFIYSIEEKKFHIEDAEFSGEEGKTLRLMTIHSAKGLESPYVIYVHKPKSNEEKVRFPMYLDKKVAFDLLGKGLIAENLSKCYLQEFVEEEKRLAYVACTRAKQKFIFCAVPSINRSSTGFFETQWESFLNKELLEKDLRYVSQQQVLDLSILQTQKISGVVEDLSAYEHRYQWLENNKKTFQEFPQFLSVSLLLDAEFNPEQFHDKYLRRSFNFVDSLRELAEEEFTLKSPSLQDIGILVHILLQKFDRPDPQEVWTYLETHHSEMQEAFDQVISYAEAYWNSDFYKELFQDADTMDKECRVVYLLPNDIMIRAVADLYISSQKRTIVDYKLSIGNNIERYSRQLSYYALLSEKCGQQVDELVLFGLKEAKAYPLLWNREETERSFQQSVTKAMDLLTRSRF
ncbi:MAG: UvrD-helicase domain-containing protein [Brevinema sp.]